MGLLYLLNRRIQNIHNQATLCVPNCRCLLTLPAGRPVAFIIHLSNCFLTCHSLSLSVRYEKQTDNVSSPTGDATSHTLHVLRALSIFGPALVVRHMRTCGDSGSISPRIITSTPCGGMKSVSRASLFALREITPVHFG
jgi:hypothetical protein